MNKLVFRVDNVYEDDTVLSLVPEVDGISLVMLTTAYESSRGYDAASGYGGIVPAFFNYGDLSSYYLGARQWPEPGTAWLLGCDCGDLGCWPLAAQITVTDATVTWSEFQQPIGQYGTTPASGRSSSTENFTIRPYSWVFPCSIKPVLPRTRDSGDTSCSLSTATAPISMVFLCEA